MPGKPCSSGVSVLRSVLGKSVFVQTEQTRIDWLSVRIGDQVKFPATGLKGMVDDIAEDEIAGSVYLKIATGEGDVWLSRDVIEKV